MISEKFSKTTSLLLIATFALAMAGTVSAADVGAMDALTGLPSFLSDDVGNDSLELLTFFLFFVGYIAMGAAFVFFMSERSNVAPQYRTTMTISALIVGIAASTTTTCVVSTLISASSPSSIGTWTGSLQFH